MRPRRVLGCALVALALPTAGAAAQTGGSCVVENSRVLNGINRGTEYEVIFVGGPTIACTGQMRVQADSAVMSAQTKIIEFIGRVNFRDTAKTLTTQYAQYHARDRRLIAQGEVVLTDLKSGSVITGPFLDYYQASDTRAEEEVRISAGRPRAVMVRAAADSIGRDTTVVDADGMEIFGQSRFIGRGNVEITRGTTRAWSQTAEFAQGGGALRLIGAARVESDSLRMAGDSIVGDTDASDQFRDLQAWGSDATVEGEAVDIEAPWIRLLFEAGEIERLIAAAQGAAPAGAIALASDTLPPDTLAAAADSLAAAADSLAAPPDSLGADPAPAVPVAPLMPSNAAPGSAEGPRARAVSADFRLLGDSIDALAPGRVLERVVAVGHAFGERLAPEDTLSAGLPEVARRDWLEGEVIRATFADAPETRPDTAPERVLERVVALGEPARSIYRRIDPDAADAGYAISYLFGRRIEIRLAEGEVEAVHAEAATGLYLQPRATANVRRPPTPVRQ